MNKLSRDIFFSTTFSILNVLFSMWLIRNAEFTLSAISLGVFLLMRRVATSFTNLSQLGASQGIVRFISLNNDDEHKKRIYFFISFLGWFISIIILVGIYFLAGDKLANYTYYIENNKIYFSYTLWYIAILHLSYLVQPYFLTQRKIIFYNLINTLNASVIMLLIFIYFAKSADLIHVLYYSFLIMSALQVILMLFIVVKLKVYKVPNQTILYETTKEFYTYSFPRSLMTFLDMFLLTVGALLVTNKDIVIAPFLLTLVLARMVLVVLQPISKLSSVIIGNDNTKEKQDKAINLMTGSVLYFTVLFIIIMTNWLNVLIHFWLSDPENKTEVIYGFNIIAISLIPYAIFHGLKGIIEIQFFKPYNLFSLITAVIIHITLFLILKNYYSTLLALLLSLTASFIVLGGLSLFWCRKYLYKIKYYRLDILTGLTIILFGINYFMNLYFQNIFGLFLSSIITVIIYVAILYFSNIQFIRDSIQTLLKKSR